MWIHLSGAGSTCSAGFDSCGTAECVRTPPRLRDGFMSDTSESRRRAVCSLLPSPRLSVSVASDGLFVVKRPFNSSGPRRVRSDGEANNCHGGDVQTEGAVR